MQQGEARTVIVQAAVNVYEQTVHQFTTSTPFVMDELAWTTPASVAVVVTAPPSTDSMELYALASGARFKTHTAWTSDAFPYTAFEPAHNEHADINDHIATGMQVDHVPQYRAQAEQLDMRIGLVRRTQCRICAPVGSYVMYDHALSLPPERFVPADQARHHRDVTADDAWAVMCEQGLYCPVCLPGELLSGDMDTDITMLQDIGGEEVDEDELLGEAAQGQQLGALWLMLESLMVGHDPLLIGGRRDLDRVAAVLVEHADSVTEEPGPAFTLAANLATGLDLSMVEQGHRPGLVTDYLWRLMQVMDTHGGYTTEIASLRDQFYDGNARGLLG